MIPSALKVTSPFDETPTEEVSTVSMVTTSAGEKSSVQQNSVHVATLSTMVTTIPATDGETATDGEPMTEGEAQGHVNPLAIENPYSTGRADGEINPLAFESPYAIRQAEEPVSPPVQEKPYSASGVPPEELFHAPIEPYLTAERHAELELGRDRKGSEAVTAAHSSNELSVAVPDVKPYSTAAMFGQANELTVAMPEVQPYSTAAMFGDSRLENSSTAKPKQLDLSSSSKGEQSTPGQEEKTTPMDFYSIPDLDTKWQNRSLKNKGRSKSNAGTVTTPERSQDRGRLVSSASVAASTPASRTPTEAYAMPDLETKWQRRSFKRQGRLNDPVTTPTVTIHDTLSDDRAPTSPETPPIITENGVSFL